MCGEWNPLLSGALPAFETFLARWKQIAMSRNYPQLAPFLDEGLSLAIKYHKLMCANKAYLYAMCKSFDIRKVIFTVDLHFKVTDLSVRFTWVQSHWGMEAVQARADILDKVMSIRSFSFRFSNLTNMNI